MKDEWEQIVKQVLCDNNYSYGDLEWHDGAARDILKLIIPLIKAEAMKEASRMAKTAWLTLPRQEIGEYIGDLLRIRAIDYDRQAKGREE